MARARLTLKGPAPRVDPRRVDDRGSIALAKLAALLATVALLGYDGVSVFAAQLGAADQASTAAGAAAENYRVDSDPQRSFEAALRSLTVRTESIDPRSFTVHPDGTVRLTVHRTAPTLWLRRIAPLAHLARVCATGQGGA